MDVEIAPEPSDEERSAILAALELEQREVDEPSPWRRAGLEPGEDPITDLRREGPEATAGESRRSRRPT